MFFIDSKGIRVVWSVSGITREPQSSGLKVSGRNQRYYWDRYAVSAKFSERLEIKIPIIKFSERLEIKIPIIRFSEVPVT